ncbi:MAG: tyrosine-type recombinase/integrase [Planctomycetes bacterium]|nr:tyrosine-type recombinase/integrase [Planctomycetota bacterium]
MAKRPSRAQHTGRTAAGHTRDVNVERVRNVTIYKRGKVFYLYYRELGRSVRRRIDGNLATARATASKVAAALDEHRPSPLGFLRVDPDAFVTAYLNYTEMVQQLALRSRERYRAALELFKGFAKDQDIRTVDQFSEASVEHFVRWLRERKRARNGRDAGVKAGYKTGGVKFILSTCRTAFNWAARHRYLPPFAANPFSTFPIEKLRDRDAEDAAPTLLTPKEQKAFFKACDDWQRRIFQVLVVYGLRVGELTHLLVEDVDLKQEAIQIRSKPWLAWRVKTGRERLLPIFEEVVPLFEAAIGGRKAGFVFLNEAYATGAHSLPAELATPQALRQRAQAEVDALRGQEPEASELKIRRTLEAFGRQWGQIPEKRIRQEFMRLTRKIGRPELTKVHDLRHLFASRAQELGLNPLLVQDLLGHRTLDMTRRYTHIGLDAKRKALRKSMGGLWRP